MVLGRTEDWLARLAGLVREGQGPGEGLVREGQGPGEGLVREGSGEDLKATWPSCLGGGRGWRPRGRPVISRCTNSLFRQVT